MCIHVWNFPEKCKIITILKAFSLKAKKKKIYVFQVSQPYLGFFPQPKTFYYELWAKCQICWKMYWKMQFLYKIFWSNKNLMLCRLTGSSFFRAETWNAHIYIFFGLMNQYFNRVFAFMILTESHTQNRRKNKTINRTWNSYRHSKSIKYCLKIDKTKFLGV